MELQDAALVNLGRELLAGGICTAALGLLDPQSHSKLAQTLL